MEYSQEQQDAIAICNDPSLVIACVTGQAGTGKTTILKGVYNALLEKYQPWQIALAAPTGRAAKRIQEATGIDAKTIHRLLRYSVPADDDDGGLPRHDKFNPLPHEVILIDEASMIDTTLYRGLVDAMKRGAIIRFFGDVNQLPPVANDSKSSFAIAMERFPTAVLTHNYRSDDGIISVSDRIIKGRMPLANEQVNIFTVKSTDTMYRFRDLCEEMDFTLQNVQIITPTQRTTYGCDKLNTFIQQRYNPEKEKITTFQKGHDGKPIVRSFKRGDKILWTKNNYDLDLMNGTLGVVTDFDEESGTIHAIFDDKDMIIPSSMETFNPTTGQRYTYDPRNSLMLGYAITTHKSQGSQFDVVLYVVSRSRAATRQNLYTAVTRAKKKLLVMNVANALSHAINTNVRIT